MGGHLLGVGSGREAPMGGLLLGVSVGRWGRHGGGFAGRHSWVGCCLDVSHGLTTFLWTPVGGHLLVVGRS